MKKQGLRLITLMMALLMLVGMVSPAMAEGDVILNNLTVDDIYGELGDTLNYGAVAVVWEKSAHAESSAAVDYLLYFDKDCFANSDNTYAHAFGYELKADITAPSGTSLAGTKFALFTESNGTYTKVADTDKTVTEASNEVSVTWEVSKADANNRLYVMQLKADGTPVMDNTTNSDNMLVTYGPSITAYAQNDIYVGKIVFKSQINTSDEIKIFNRYDNQPSITFGPDMKLYYMENNELHELDFSDPTRRSPVYVSYFYPADNSELSPTDTEKLEQLYNGTLPLAMSYAKLDGLTYEDGLIFRESDGKRHVIDIKFASENGRMADKIAQAKEYSKQLANMGGGQINPETNGIVPIDTGSSTVTGPVDEYGRVVSLYDVDVSADNDFDFRDMGYGYLPVADNEYVVVNVIAGSKDGTLRLGANADNTKYSFYKDGQLKQDGASFGAGATDGTTSQRVIFNVVYADENGILQPFEGTILPGQAIGGTILAPAARVVMNENSHQGSMIVDTIRTTQEIHQRTFIHSHRSTWVKMNGGYLKLNKISGEWDFSNGMMAPAEGDPLAGAVFGVYADQDCTQLLEEITTDKNGVATSGLLAAGTYWVKEIKAPNGYSISNNMGVTQVVQVTVTAGQTVTVDGPGYQWGYTTIGDGKFVNMKSQEIHYGDLRVEKIISDNGKPLQGVTFGVYTRQGGYGQPYTYELVGTMTTNRNGVAVYYDLPLEWEMFGQLYPHAYFVKEISAPEGYEISNGDYVAVTLIADQMVTVDGNGDKDGNAFENEIIRGNMKLTKVSAADNSVKLGGAEFTIYSDASCTTEVGVMKTNPQGYADSTAIEQDGKQGLLPGTYYVKETKAPGGYRADGTVYTVKVLPDQTVDVVEGNIIENEEGVTIKVEKNWQDKNYQNQRPGSIKVGLFRGAESAPFMTQQLSNANEWKHEFTDLPKYDANNELIVYTVKEWDNGNLAQNYFVFTETKTEPNGTVKVVFTNSIRKVNIDVKKQWTDNDSQWDSAKPDQIVYELYYIKNPGNQEVQMVDATGNPVTAIGTKNDNWTARFENLPLYAATGEEPIKYVVKEQASGQYVQTENSGLVDKGNDRYEITFTNQAFVRIWGRKTWEDNNNAANKRPMPDQVNIVLYQAENQGGTATKVEPQPEITWKTTDGNTWEWEFNGLPKGPYYTVQEENVPDGYVANVQGDANNGYNITNTYSSVYINVTKAWSGINENTVLPASVTVQLYAGGQKVEGKTLTLTAADNWQGTFENLPKKDQYNNDINYTVKEEPEVEGFRVSGEGNQNNNYTITNSAIGGFITLKKVDADNPSTGLQDAVFGVYSDQACQNKVTEMTTDNNGNAKSIELAPGTYWVKEDQAPAGYTINKTDAVSVTVVKDQTVTAMGDAADGAFTNTAGKGKLFVKKVGTDSNGNNPQPLAGAEFTVYDGQDNVKGVMVTDAQGYAEIELPVGNYQIKETKAPTGYRIEDNGGKWHNIQNVGQSVQVWGNYTYNGESGWFQNKQVATGGIKLTKVSAQDQNEKLSGAVFYVYSDQNCQNKVGEMTTDANGIASLTGLEANRQYWVKEYSAPEGYELNTQVYNVYVNANNDDNWVNNNNPITNNKKQDKGAISLTKVSAEDANTKLQGAVFGVYSDENCSQEVGRMTTGQNGEAKLENLIAGNTYWVKEIQAPSNYQLNPEKYSVTVVKDTTTSVNNGNPITNEVKRGAEYYFFKGTVENNAFKALEGAEFTLYSDAACTQVITKATSDANGRVTFYVPVDYNGIAYIRETVQPVGYDPIPDGTYSFHASGTSSNAQNIGYCFGNLLNHNYSIEGGFLVNNKQVSQTGGFKFTKQTTEGTALPGAVFGVYEEEACTTQLHELTSDASGVVALADLEAGKTYYIKEITAPTGYVLDATVYSVTIEANVNDKPVGNNGVIVNNKIADAKARLQAGKTLNGAVPAAGQFSFTLTGNGVNDTKQNDANGLVVFDELTFTAAGTYVYQITEQKPNPIPAGYTYDENTYTATVNVALNAQGTALEASVSYNTPDGNAPVFQNTYTAQGSVTFAGTKTLTGKTLEAGQFSFELCDADGNRLQTVTNDADGNITFAPITYTLSDVANSPFTYTVSEVSGNLAGVDYDDTVYTVEVTVSDNGSGALVVVPTANYNALAFENEYKAEGEIVLVGTKSMTGRALAAGEFSFELYDADGNKLQTVTNDANGNITFAPITYTLSDVESSPFTYTVSEVSGNLPGVTYDAAPVTVKVAVTDAGNGELNVVKTADSAEILFTNTYSAEGEIVLAGTKSLTGRALAAGEFSFELYDADGNKLQTVSNDANGAFAFAPIEYSLSDVESSPFTYTVKEVSGSLPGVTYSNAVINVEVQVVDNGGSLSATLTQNSQPITFTNEYTASGSVQLTAQKELLDKQLEEGMFSFKLMDAAGNELQTKQNAADGTITFDAINYTQNDLAFSPITYKIQEVAGTDSDIVYDTHVEEVQVTLTDNGDGTITATPDKAGAAVKFTNDYEKYCDLDPSVEKRMAGRPFQEGDTFTFVIVGEGEAPMPERTNVTVTPEVGSMVAQVDFGFIRYTEEDVGNTYRYTITENGGNIAGVQYDSTVYTLSVEVTEEGEQLIALADYPTGNSVTFTNTYAAEGSVVLSAKKVLTGKQLEEGMFTFELTDANDELLQTATNGADGSITFEAISYDLDDLESSPFLYKIREKAGDDESITYATNVETVTVTLTDNGDGTITATADKTGAQVTFTNTYAAEGSFQLVGEKVIKGRQFKTGDTFTFTVEAAAGVPMPENTTVTVTPASGDSVAIDFGSIAYTEADAGKEYVYTVKETAGNIAGITYDADEHTVTVNVTDNGDGTMKATATYSDGEGLKITNVYGAKGEWTLTAGKTVDGQTATEDQVFDFGLYENGILVGEVVKNQAGTITFPKVIYTEEDAGKEFTYTVKELGFSGTASDTFSYVCDPTVFTVIVKVEDADGQLTISWKTDDGKTAITFENTRLWKIELEKSDILNSANKLPGAVYTLYRDKECTDKYADITTGVGGVGFLRDVPAGTYWVKETKAPAGYKVDPNAYEVQVPNGEDVTKPVFVPVQDYPMEGELTLDVEKVMTGRAFQAGDTFTFTISAVSGVPMPEQTMVTINPSSGNTAKVDFGKIEYTYDDDGKTYEYTIKETAGNIQGVTYDTKFHTVQVTITADAANENIIAVPTYSDGEKTILTNVYTAENELRLDVEKVIKGRAFQAGDSFTFTVEAAENVPMPETAEVTIEPTSGTTAIVDFGKITYSQDDIGNTYQYTVKEKATDIAGITCDTTAYTVSVEITDNGDGTLTVTPTYEKGNRVTFTNNYNAAGTYQLTATKILEGKELENGKFTFVLKNEAGKELETATNDANGLISFRAMNFTQKDVGSTFTYLISERIGNEKGYSYDATEYTVKLTVLDNGDGTLKVEAEGIPADGMTFTNYYSALTTVSFTKVWQGAEGPAITLTLYANGQKVEPQPAYKKVGNLYVYEDLQLNDENDKPIVYSAKEAFMDGYMTIYENTGDHAGVTDQVMNGGKIINRSVTGFSVQKVWEGLGEGEEKPAITLTLYCNGKKVDKPTPTPDKNGWYHYYNLPATVDGEAAVYYVLEEELEGFATSYLSSGEEVNRAENGDTIVNRKIPQTGDNSHIGLWLAVTMAAAGAMIVLLKKRKVLG